MAQWKMVGVSQLLLGYSKSLDLASATIDAVITSLTVGAGQGVNFAGVSVNSPAQILIDGEAMQVTGRSVDTLTVIRGALGTTAAGHTAGTGNVKAIIDLQVPYTRQFAVNAQTTEITFQGDGEQDYVSLHLGLRGTINADKWLTDIWEKIMGIVATTANLPPDEATRWMPDAGNYPALRLRLIMHAIDDDTGLDTAVRLEIPKAQIYPRPWQPGSSTTAAKDEFVLAWTAQRTRKDLLGVTLPGALPTRGVFYTLAQLSTPLP